MNKNKAKIVISTLGFIFIFLYFCVYKEELITKAINEDGEVINFNIYGENENVPDFKIVVNKSKKIIKVIDRKDEKPLNKFLGSKKYFSVTLNDKNNKKKYSTTLLGNDKGSSSKLDGLDNYTYEYGDYLKFFIDNEKNMKLSGAIKGLRNFYLRLEDLKFNLTQEGIKVQDNKYGVAYNIGFNNNITLKIGESFDPLKGIIVTNEYEEDYISNLKVIGNVDTNVPGKYVIQYVVVDRGYVSIPTKRTIIVINELSKEAIRKMENIDGIYEELKIKDHKCFKCIDRKINKFIIKFNREGNEKKDEKRRTKRTN